MTSNYMKQVVRVEDRFRWENYLTNRDLLYKAKLLKIADESQKQKQVPYLHSHHHHHNHLPPHHAHYHCPRTQARRFSKDDMDNLFEKFAFAKHINRLSYTYGKFHPDVNDDDVEEAYDVENYLVTRDLARKYFSYDV